MINLLNQYSLTEIIIFIFLLFIAVKEAMTLIDFFYTKIKTYSKNEHEEINEKEEILEQIKSLKSDVDFFKTEFKDFRIEYEEMQKRQNERLNLLTNSDMAAIRSAIVQEYHTFMNAGWIDDFSLDALEKRFLYYKEEGGNSYAANLMKNLRALPNIPPEQKY